MQEIKYGGPDAKKYIEAYKCARPVVAPTPCLLVCLPCCPGAQLPGFPPLRGYPAARLPRCPADPLPCCRAARLSGGCLTSCLAPASHSHEIV